MGTPEDGASRSHAVVRAAWITVAVIVGVLALGAVATYVTASPTLCGACHEMKSAVVTWEQSPHNRVGCPSCHETPRPWYQFPQTLLARGAMLGRDLDAHFSAGYAATPGTSIMSTVTVPDSTCEQCHDPSRKVTMRYGTLIDHKEHAKRNKSCMSCHVWTAHPTPGYEKPLLLMEQCFNCHGKPSNPKASGACTACHPASFNKRPASHGPTKWTSLHGKAALKGIQQCSMCHAATFCGDCHGVPMPHPVGWEAGKTGHGVTATRDRSICAKCHTGKADMCGMCHHKGFEPTKGPWLAQHPAMVEKRGVAFCLGCHAPTYCVFCHAREEQEETEPDADNE
ncbi:MAG: NapC/NirT family cytochrome c [Coriobacteriia bacterium]|nr:NapC/NirT family cytochrome c [Coriobacteriia bacterium]